MSTEAGQLFSMMRSFSAAEIAKRFNSGEGWFAPGTSGSSGTQSSLPNLVGTTGSSGTNASQLSTQNAPVQTGQTSPATAAQTPDSFRQTDPKPSIHTRLVGDLPQSAPPRPAAQSVAHLAAPKLTLVHVNLALPSEGMVAQDRATHTQGSRPAAHPAAAQTQPAIGAPVRNIQQSTPQTPNAARSMIAGQTLSAAPSVGTGIPSQASSATSTSSISPTVPSGQSVPTGLDGSNVTRSSTPTQNVQSALSPSLATPQNPASDGRSAGILMNTPNSPPSVSQAPLAAPTSPTTQQNLHTSSTSQPSLSANAGQTAATSVTQTVLSQASGKADLQANPPQGQAQPSGTTGVPTPTQNIASHGIAVPILTEAVAAALESAVAGRGQSANIASGVIFNAAMMPGWPFPSALVRDAGGVINDKAILHKLAEQVGKMSPEEAAEYLAKIGGGFAVLRNLRKLIKEIEGIDQKDVEGLLSAFLNIISSVADSIQVLLEQLDESEALQNAVVHGDEEGQANRHRLKL